MSLVDDLCIYRQLIVENIIRPNMVLAALLYCNGYPPKWKETAFDKAIHGTVQEHYEERGEQRPSLQRP